MLALSRREGETVFVGEFEIVVLTVGKDLAQLRISHTAHADNIFIEMWAGKEREFRIGKLIVVRVAVIRDKVVRICFEAPREITILRGEISDRYPKPTNHAESGRMDGRSHLPGIH